MKIHYIVLTLLIVFAVLKEDTIIDKYKTESGQYVIQMTGSYSPSLGVVDTTLVLIRKHFHSGTNQTKLFFLDYSENRKDEDVFDAAIEYANKRHVNNIVLFEETADFPDRERYRMIVQGGMRWCDCNCGQSPIYLSSQQYNRDYNELVINFEVEDQPMTYPKALVLAQKCLNN